MKTRLTFTATFARSATGYLPNPLSDVPAHFRNSAAAAVMARYRDLMAMRGRS